MFEWNPHSMTRLLSARGRCRGGECLEVQVHLDGSVFYIKEHGNFISHLTSNCKDTLPLRNFTCDTIPFVVRSIDEAEGQQYNPQEMLAPAFLILGQPY